MGGLAQPPQDVHLSSTCPQAFQLAACVSGLAASITTSKVATSLPWQASSTDYFFHLEASEPALHPVLTGGSYSDCMAEHLTPRPLSWWPGPCPATWLLGPLSPNSSHCKQSCWWHQCTYSGAESPVGGASPMSTSLSTSSPPLPPPAPPWALHSSYTCCHILAWR